MPVFHRRRVIFLVMSAIAVLPPNSAPAQQPDPRAAKIRFPASPYVVDVSQPPYSAPRDGVSDASAAIQRAINDTTGQHKILYFPSGTYLISNPLVWTNRIDSQRNAYGFNWLQGESAATTVLRLKDKSLTDPAKPKAILWCGGFGSADWFHNYFQDLTFDVGVDNPGAIGLQFYSNNTGAVRNCRIVSGDGQGAIGLDLSHRDMNGSHLIQQVEVKGFRRGVVTANAVNSHTFEDVRLAGQTEFGFDNHGQAVAIAGLEFDGPAIAVRSYGTAAIVGAKFRGSAAADKLPACVNYNGGRIFLRDVATTGYARAAADVSTPDFFAALRVSGPDKPGSQGPNIDEYTSHTATNPFGGSEKSLRLPIEAPPRIAWEDNLANWAVVDRFGADPTAARDSSAAIQKAIDSGASTIFFPGHYLVERPVIVRGNAARLIGTGGHIDYHSKSRPDFIVADGTAKAVILEHFAPINGGIEIRTDRTVILRSLEARRIDHRGKGNLFLEDVATDDFRLSAGQKVWARQLNIENEGFHLTNDGGELWVLGYKTERGGTLSLTKNGGRSEIFGTLSYTTTAGKLAPMFVNDDSSVFAFLAEVCYTGDPFAVLVRESRGGIIREIRRGQGSTTPYVGIPSQKR